MRFIFSLLLFFMISHINAQSNFGQDEIFRLEACSPNIKYRSSGVKEVRITEYWSQTKNKIVSFKRYNSDGYLVRVENTDYSFIPGKEVIDIETTPGNVFIVKRKIGTVQFKKIAPVFVHTFWGVYYSLKLSDKIVRLITEDTVNITDSLKWAPDSSIAYRTLLNGKLIDTDTVVTVVTKMDSSAVLKCEFLWEKNVQGGRDSIVICSSQPDAGNYRKEMHTYKKEVLIRSVTEYFSTDTLQSWFTVNYYYSRSGKISREETINWLGDTIKLKIFNYERGAGYFYCIKIYSLNKELVSTTYYDRNNRILMREMPPPVFSEDLSMIKEKYNYSGNGLLKSFKVWHDEKLVYLKNYYYTKYLLQAASSH